MNLLNG